MGWVRDVVALGIKRAATEGKLAVDVAFWGGAVPGNAKDLRRCVFAPVETFVVDPARLLHRNPISPYAGRELRGVVEQTWLHSVPIRDGERRGQLVRPTQR